jgi:hypothetical protein
MGIILLVLLLALVLGGLGFAIHVLWWIALAVLVIWLLGFALRAGEGASRGRWYRWLLVPLVTGVLPAPPPASELATRAMVAIRIVDGSPRIGGEPSTTISGTELVSDLCRCGRGRALRKGEALGRRDGLVSGREGSR